MYNALQVNFRVKELLLILLTLNLRLNLELTLLKFTEWLEFSLIYNGLLEIILHLCRKYLRIKRQFIFNIGRFGRTFTVQTAWRSGTVVCWRNCELGYKMRPPSFTGSICLCSKIYSMDRRTTETTFERKQYD